MLTRLLAVVLAVGGCGLPSFEGGDTAAHAPKASACVCMCGTTAVSTPKTLAKPQRPCQEDEEKPK